jgi:hypothetical protein
MRSDFDVTAKVLTSQEVQEIFPVCKIKLEI